MTIRRLDAPIDFKAGDAIVDSRCGIAVTGTVTQVRGNSVYYRDNCSACVQDGRHHRTQADFSTTSKGEAS
ncbi:hypothetical protein [Streptomyces sp. NPDC048252]|uniref:hypothetical protein n=1 Tax=Streptomyces sp. NPDC048252 TaxID=3154612 RepID=UPI00341C55A8